MSFVSGVIQRLKRDCFRWQYNRVVQRIADTPPISSGTTPFTVLSMVQKRDVHAYLVAVKSFTHFFLPQRVVVVCDPTLDDTDKALLKRHIPHIELRHADEFVHPDIPRGGTWERLYAISQYVRDTYVIQLDADTVTVQPIAEVVAAVKNKQGFVIVEKAGTTLDTPEQANALATGWLGTTEHVQMYAEIALSQIGLPASARYVRGCSGFTGFPVSSDMRERLIDFSKRMRAKLGNKWTQWGTEQVTSNYLVANSHAVQLLPFPKYATPDVATSETAFYHFIGYLRFVNSKYAVNSGRVIDLLRQARDTASVAD